MSFPESLRMCWSKR